MNIVLLSGGSGKRLWPLSNDVRSKQFLKLLCDEDGNHESMVQRVYRQIVHAGIDAEIVVATSAAQVESIRVSGNCARGIVSGIQKEDESGGDGDCASGGSLCGCGIF